MRSDRIDPTNLDVPARAILAISASTDGNEVSSDPRWGVPRKRMAVTDFRMLS